MQLAPIHTHKLPSLYALNAESSYFKSNQLAKSPALKFCVVETAAARTWPQQGWEFHPFAPSRGNWPRNYATALTPSAKLIKSIAIILPVECAEILQPHSHISLNERTWKKNHGGADLPLELISNHVIFCLINESRHKKAFTKKQHSREWRAREEMRLVCNYGRARRVGHF